MPNAYASKICAGKIKDPSGVKRKDFRGPKPAKAMGGRIYKAKGGVSLQERAAERKKLIEKSKPAREKIGVTKPAKADGGLMAFEGRKFREKQLRDKQIKDRRRAAEKNPNPRKNVRKGKYGPGMMGGGLMEATQRLRRQGLKRGGGVCLRGMNREAIGKNS